jgi:hypothetical protein
VVCFPDFVQPKCFDDEHLRFDHSFCLRRSSMGKHRKMVLFSPAGTKASEKRILKKLPLKTAVKNYLSINLEK